MQDTNENQKPTMEQAQITMKFDSHMYSLTNHIIKTENLEKEQAQKKAWDILQPIYKEMLENLSNTK